MPRDQSQEEAMTIALSVSGQTSEPQLEEDEFHMLWLAHRNRRNSGRVQILLSAALQNGGASSARRPTNRRCHYAHPRGTTP
jgi:hypothetical protein